MYVRILRNIERPQAKDLAGVAVFMLQFDVELCRIESNVAHKVQRYINLFVASELVSDVEEFILASSPRGLRSKAGGPNKSVHRRGCRVHRE